MHHGAAQAGSDVGFAAAPMQSVMAICHGVSANMFRGQGIAKPRVKSLVGALAAMVSAILGSQASPMLGYVFALSALVMLTDSIWSTQSRKENSLVFSLFWLIERVQQRC